MLHKEARETGEKMHLGRQDPKGEDGWQYWHRDSWKPCYSEDTAPEIGQTYTSRGITCLFTCLGFQKNWTGNKQTGEKEAEPGRVYEGENGEVMFASFS